MYIDVCIYVLCIYVYVHIYIICISICLYADSGLKLTALAAPNEIWFNFEYARSIHPGSSEGWRPLSHQLEAQHRRRAPRNW
jgi:hypothetical protein